MNKTQSSFIQLESKNEEGNFLSHKQDLNNVGYFFLNQGCFFSAEVHLSIHLYIQSLFKTNDKTDFAIFTTKKAIFLL